MKLAVILIFVTALPLATFAQESPGMIDELVPQIFDVDYAAFADTNPNSMVLEVYYKIFTSSLTFEKWGAGFKADYIIDITINQKGHQVTGSSHDGSLAVDDYKKTISREDFIINKEIFHVSPGNYELQVRLKDSKAIDIARPLKTDVKFRDFGKKIPGMSSIEFVREGAAADSGSEFVRHGYKLIPSVSRIYGDDQHDLDFYYEVYNDSGFSGDYLAIYTISDGDRLILCDSTMFPSSGAVTPHLERLNVDTLLAEQYKLMIELQSPGSKMKIKYGDQFVIGWSVAGTVKNDFKTAVEQLRYIANKEEMKKLNDAPVAERKKAWEEFWKSQDRTPGTADNEVREEYYKRLRYADINYGNFGRNGWKTDMGMVYITYGPPDEVERHPFDIDAKPYQIWYYYNSKRVFRFVDVNGYGEYQLIYPYDGDTRKIR